MVTSSAEPWIMLHPIYALREQGISTEYSHRGATEGLHDFLHNYVEGISTYHDAVRAMAEVLYGAAIANAKATIFLDKTPRYYYIISELYQLFPEAKFIFLFRNPLSVLMSILNTWVGVNWLALEYWRDDLLMAPENMLSTIERSSSNTAVVRYEDIVTSPGETVSRLCALLGIEYEEQMLTLSMTTDFKGRHGDQHFVSKFSAPVTDSLEKWKDLARSEQTRHFGHAYLNALGKTVVEAMGYSFNKLHNGIENSIPETRGNVIPWEIAMRPAAERSRRDRWLIERLMAIQSFGTIRGLTHFSKHRLLLLYNRALDS